MDKGLIELQQYKDYVSSTQKLNDALNKELTTCYERIEKMIGQLIQAQIQQQDYLKEISKLKDTVQQLEADKRNITKTKTSQRIFSLESIGDSGNNYSNQRNQIFNNTSRKVVKQQSRGTQTRKHRQQKQLQKVIQQFKTREQKITQEHNIEIQQLVNQKICLKNDFEISFQQTSILRRKSEKLQQQLKNWEYKCDQIENHRIETIHQMLTQKQTLLYEIRKRDLAIGDLQQKVYYHDNHFQKINQQQDEIQYLRSKLVNSLLGQKSQQQIDNLKQTNQNLQRILNEYQQKVVSLQTQNQALKRTQSYQQKFQRKQNKSIEIKKNTLIQTQLKMVKQQYTQAIKQNISLIQANSKLEKKRNELFKQLQVLKKQNSQIQHRFSELSIQNQHHYKQLEKKRNTIQDMNNKIALKQNQAQQLKTKASQEIILKLQKSLNSPLSPKIQSGLLFDSVRKNNFYQKRDQQVPVRDISNSNPRLIKSKSTIIAMNFR